MKAKYYNLIKKTTSLVKSAILTCLIVIAANINASAQSVPGCPATVALTPVSTSCGVNSVDILPNINAYLTGVLHLNLSLLTVTVFTDNDLTHPLASTILTQSGTYIIKVTTPITGCVAALSIAVVIKTNPTADATHTPISCFGGYSNVTVTASGGTGPYTGTGTFQQATADGNKTYTVSDNYGCQGSVTVNTISQPTKITATFAPANNNDSVCYGFNRRMFVNASGGTPGYTYSFDGSGTYQVDSNLIKGAGTHSAQVKDANGCIVSTNTVTIRQPATRQRLSATSVETACNKSSITISGTGGYGGYTFSLDNVSYQLSPVFANRAPGSDSLFLKDKIGCLAKGKITIAPSNLAGSLAPSSNIDSVACVGYQRTINAAGTGGKAPYMYSFDGGAFQSSKSTTVPAGAHNALVKDALGCIVATNSVTIRQPAEKLSAKASSAIVSCNNSTITVNSQGGWGGYSYSFNAGAYQASNTFTGIGAGTDTIVVKDNAGCITKTSITLKASTLAASLAASNNIDSVQCFGFKRTVLATATGGTAPYTYSIDGSVFKTTNNFVQPAGAWVASVKDAYGCVATSNTVTIRQPADRLRLSAAIQPTSCSQSSVTVNATGGWGGYTYSINNGGYQNSMVFTGVAQGDDSIAVKDNAGCITKAKVTVAPYNLSATLAASGNIDSVQCLGYSRTISASASGGNGAYMYKVDTSAYQASRSFIVPAGTHTVTVKDSLGCTAVTNALNITQPATALVVNYATQNVSCNNTSITVSAVGGYGNYTYSLNYGTYQGNNEFTGLPAGTYIVTAKDNGGCVRGKTVVVNPPASPCLGAGGQSASASNSSDALSAGKSIAGFDLRLKAYPNPSRGDFNLSIEGKTANPIIEVRVFDMHGNIVYQTRGASTRSFVFGSKLASGTYTVQVIDGRNVQTTKLIKAN